MSYKIKEIFFTLQGEGAQAGRPAVFCRFTGCNLWTGREEDRHKAVCQFCDTDFIGMDGLNGGKYETAESVAQKVASLWPARSPYRGNPLVVCTGGEPMLQLDAALMDAFHVAGFEAAIETNGTLDILFPIDWICVSPKANTELAVKKGNELKLVFPQKDAQPEQFSDLSFDRFYLQPMDGPLADVNTKLALAYCLENPQWSLSLQTHKLLQIP